MLALTRTQPFQGVLDTPIPDSVLEVDQAELAEVLRESPDSAVEPAVGTWECSLCTCGNDVSKVMSLPLHSSTCNRIMQSNQGFLFLSCHFMEQIECEACGSAKPANARVIVPGVDPVEQRKELDRAAKVQIDASIGLKKTEVVLILRACINLWPGAEANNP
jgi:hypothetical protein